MRGWSASEIARRAAARVVREATGAHGPGRAVIDSREVGPGDLFVGLAGARSDGGSFAPGALDAGAWGVLVAPEHAERAAAEPGGGAVLAAERPLAALQTLARAWREELGATVIGITGSTGKTSTKDILAAVLAPARRTVASRQNLNTEIGLPLAVLEAPAGTEVLVLELAMRGPGQIAELARICRPDVGVIVNIGPVHLELLGTVEAVAAAKAELIAGLEAGKVAILPAGEPLLEPHRRSDVTTVTFGDGGDVSLRRREADGTVSIDTPGGEVTLRPAFSQAHQIQNLLAAVAAARCIGVTPAGELDVTFSALRGERLALPGGILVVNDCYNANPMSMRAALDDLAATAAGRRVAVLGDMLELGPEEDRFHRELGAHARRAGVDVLVTVGSLAAHAGRAFAGAHQHAADAGAAAALVGGLVRPGDTVLVKGSRGVGLEVIAEALAAAPSSGGEGDAPPDSGEV